MHALLLLTTLLPLAAAHGFLSYPPPRGIQKEGYQIDDLKSPNRKGLCRGEPQGKLFPVKSGQSLTLGLTITAPHTGPCRVTILDKNLKNERPVAEKMDCAAPGGPGKWTIRLPSGLQGHYVLRWYWEGRHVAPAEPYEQCIDLSFGGGKGGDSYQGGDDQGEDEGQRVDGKRHQGDHAPSAPPPTYAPAPTPSYDNTPAPPSYNNGNQDSSRRPRQPKGRRPSKDDYSDNQASYNDDRRPSKDDYSDNQGSYNDDDGNRSSGGGSCTAGSYKCGSDPSAFYQCANGQWVKMACSAGTACQQTGQQITCGWAH